MHKLVVLYPTPTNPTQFENYYRTVHLPLAQKLPGALALRFSFSIDSAAVPSPYFAVFEADFVDAAAMAAAMASPAGRAVEADVPNYATGGATVLNYPVESLA